MKVEWINAFLIAVRDTFQRMLSLQARAGKPQLLTKLDESGNDISGMIGVSGDLRGMVVMGFSTASALSFVEALVGERYQDLCSDVSDAIGEIVNIVAGYAKQHMDAGDVRISLPSVIRGPGHRVQLPKGLPVLVIPFHTERGDFVLGVSLKASDAAD